MENYGKSHQEATRNSLNELVEDERVASVERMQNPLTKQQPSQTRDNTTEAPTEYPWIDPPGAKPGTFEYNQQWKEKRAAETRERRLEALKKANQAKAENTRKRKEAEKAYNEQMSQKMRLEKLAMEEQALKAAQKEDELLKRVKNLKNKKDAVKKGSDWGTSIQQLNRAQENQQKIAMLEQQTANKLANVKKQQQHQQQQQQPPKKQQQQQEEQQRRQPQKIAKPATTSSGNPFELMSQNQFDRFCEQYLAAESAKKPKRQDVYSEDVDMGYDEEDEEEKGDWMEQDPYPQKRRPIRKRPPPAPRFTGVRRKREELPYGMYSGGYDHDEDNSQGFTPANIRQFDSPQSVARSFGF